MGICCLMPLPLTPKELDGHGCIFLSDQSQFCNGDQDGEVRDVAVANERSTTKAVCPDLQGQRHDFTRHPSTRSSSSRRYSRRDGAQVRDEATEDQRQCGNRGACWSPTCKAFCMRGSAGQSWYRWHIFWIKQIKGGYIMLDK